MVTTRRTTYARLCAPLACSLALAVGGCSGDDGSGKAPDVSMTPGKLCGGGAVNKGGAEALKVITCDTRFAASGKYSTVADAAEELTDKATYRNFELGDICRIYPDDSANELRIRAVASSGIA
ncbi:hypothetical protein [Streptomyces niveus]|uniref:hypothetical protein n=2 Tax=Streptomyces TaxID=1883 RepID=UPI00114CC5E6|nr:hypothetical protein [Streptomyces niveus]